VKLLRHPAFLLLLVAAIVALFLLRGGPPEGPVAPAAPADRTQAREEAARYFTKSNRELGKARAALAPLVAGQDAAVEDLVAAAAVEYADGQLEATRAFVERAARRDADAPAVTFLQGQLALEAGDYAGARAKFEATLARVPTDLPTRLGLAEAENELDHLQRAEELLRSVVDVGWENGGGWYVSAVYRMTRLLVLLDGREADLQRYNLLFTELTARGLKAPDRVTVQLGELAVVRPPAPQGTSVAAPAPLAVLLPSGALPELAGGETLEAWDLDDDLSLDLVSSGGGTLRVALRRAGGWQLASAPDVQRVLCALDLENRDGGPNVQDLCVLDASGRLAFLRLDPAARAWSRRSVRTPEAPAGVLAAVVALDYDHEGDLDLALVGAFGLRLWRNDAANQEAGSFSDATAECELALTRPLSWCVSEDLDGDNDVDLLLGGPGHAVVVADSLRQGRFVDVAARVFASVPSFERAPLVLDLDGDARPELLTESGTYRRTPQGTWQHAPAPVARHGAAGAPRAHDLDLDGAVDLVHAGAAGALEVQLACGLPTASTSPLGGAALPADAGRRPWTIGDLDGDGQQDLAVLGAEGLRWVSFGRGARRGVQLSFRALRDNKRGVGATVELRAGTAYRRIYWRGQPELLGLGTAAAVDVRRVTWPNGVRDTELRLVPDERPVEGARSDEELQRTWQHVPQSNQQVGSCPFLYTWNGERFVFVTDVLGITPLGLPIAPGMFVPPDHDEYVLVKAEQLAPRDGRYVLQFTEELREVTYLDYAKLLVVDHPADTEIFPNERFTFPPFPEHHIHTVRAPLAPARATGSDGVDWTAALARDDDVHAVPFTREAAQYAGLAKPWFLELEFDRAAVERATQLRLLCTGWFYWSDSSANLAAARTPDVRFVPPLVQVPDGQGGWRDTGPPVGFPAGKTKTMVLDLTALLDRRDPRIRLATTLQLHWDSLRLAVDADDAPTQVRELPVASARLALRGFSAPLEHRDPQSFVERPERFDWDVLAAEPRWAQHPGLYTRLGETTPLLHAIDDQFVILGAGDALELVFDARALPPPAAGMRRDFLVFLDGWAKDRDPNTTQALEVEPLPFHGMSGYPYRPDEHFPDGAAHRAWRAEWNTRPALDWIRPVSPAREREWLDGGG